VLVTIGPFNKFWFGFDNRDYTYTYGMPQTTYVTTCWQLDFHVLTDKQTG